MLQQDLVLYNFEPLLESFLNFLSSPIVITSNIVSGLNDDYTMQYPTYLMYKKDRGILEQNIDKGFTAISKDVQTLLSLFLGEDIFIYNNVQNTNLITERYKEYIDLYYPDDHETREQSRIKAKEEFGKFRSEIDWSCWIVNIPTELYYETVYVFVCKDQNAKANILRTINDFLVIQDDHNVIIQNTDFWEIFNAAKSD